MGVVMQSQLFMKLFVVANSIMTTVSNFKEILAFHCAIKNIDFKCGEQSPKISLIDRQKDGYVIAIKKRCCLRCIRDFLKSKNLSVSEDENYLFIRTK